MNDEKKIPIETLRTNLLAQVECAKPETCIETMLSGWIKHPRFESPTRQTLARRVREDGFLWLKMVEITSFEAYCGLPLL